MPSAVTICVNRRQPVASQRVLICALQSPQNYERVTRRHRLTACAKNEPMPQPMPPDSGT